MIGIPRARGEVSEALLGVLEEDVHPISITPRTEVPDPLADEDLQRSLYLCYELHYRGFPGIDDRWEWEPTLLGLRAALEAQFERALRETVHWLGLRVSA